ncbi:MAG: hypothetical protein ORN50_07125 [Crocinitomicaceae bacterium]|nr:hypothetical protein [Crocinitomicaceae bacterium]
MNSNLISKAANNRYADSIPSDSSAQPKLTEDTIECPMCAEFIKIKAKICRYCGYKIAEEREARIEKITADSDTEQIYKLSDLYFKYVQNVGYEDVFLESDVRLILNSFIKIHSQKRDETYRNIVSLVKDDLGLPYKTHLLDLFREGFAFVRTNKKFKFISEDDLIVVSKSDW